MTYWLFKSEPDVFSFDQLMAKGAKGEEWTGIRNYQARNNMRKMVIGALAHPDSTAEIPAWECVDIRAVKALPRHITLDEIKTVKALSEMILVKNSRLSVQPVLDTEWKLICDLGGLKL
jgi:predicted RNA-binding protein with PUA-like domain